MTKFAIAISLWIFAMGVILLLGEKERANSFKAERKENDFRDRLEHTKRRADKKRGQKNS